jgi:hypothetical protein
MASDPSSASIKIRIALFWQSLTEIFSTILKWLFGIAGLALVVWWLLPADWRIKYAAEYMVDTDKVVVGHKPYNCDWDSAPIGSKHCHYEAVVTVYNEYGHIIEGQGLDKANPPLDRDADKVHVDWERVED